MPFTVSVSHQRLQVITAVVDLTDVRSMRGASASLQQQSSEHIQVPMVHTNFRICRDECIENPSPPIDIKYFSPEEECALGPACWMWDYLRRSGASGFLLPLSGG
jgi:NAD+ synthase (glutamine-hydrolysing)